jgi:hypothetical protein
VCPPPREGAAGQTANRRDWCGRLAATVEDSGSISLIKRSMFCALSFIRCNAGTHAKRRVITGTVVGLQVIIFMARLCICSGRITARIADEIYVGVAAHAAGVEACGGGFGGWKGSVRPKRRLVFASQAAGKAGTARALNSRLFAPPAKLRTRRTEKTRGAGFISFWDARHPKMRAPPAGEMPAA